MPRVSPGNCCCLLSDCLVRSKYLVIKWLVRCLGPPEWQARQRRVPSGKSRSAATRSRLKDKLREPREDGADHYHAVWAAGNRRAEREVDGRGGMDSAADPRFPARDLGPGTASTRPSGFLCPRGALKARHTSLISRLNHCLSIGAH